MGFDEPDDRLLPEVHPGAKLETPDSFATVMQPATKLSPQCHVLWHLARRVVLGLPMKQTAAELGVNLRTLTRHARRYR